MKKKSLQICFTGTGFLNLKKFLSSSNCSYVGFTQTSKSAQPLSYTPCNQCTIELIPLIDGDKSDLKKMTQPKETKTQPNLASFNINYKIILTLSSFTHYFIFTSSYLKKKKKNEDSNNPFSFCHMPLTTMKRLVATFLSKKTIEAFITDSC